MSAMHKVIENRNLFPKSLYSRNKRHPHLLDRLWTKTNPDLRGTIQGVWVILCVSGFVLLWIFLSCVFFCEHTDSNVNLIYELSKLNSIILIITSSCMTTRSVPDGDYLYIGNSFRVKGERVKGHDIPDACRAQ